MDALPVLLVEDNPNDIELTIRAFSHSGIANPILTARDGVEALELLHATGAHVGAPPLVPAVILLDLNLPRIDGLECLRRLRADPRTRLLPVVILTTSVEDDDRIKGYERGANSYIRKPVDFGEFAKVVATLGVYWLAINVPPPLPSTPITAR